MSRAKHEMHLNTNHPFRNHEPLLNTRLNLPLIVRIYSESNSKDVYNVAKYSFKLYTHQRILFSTLIIIINVSWSVISEGSRDTEDWSNDDLITGIN